MRILLGLLTLVLISCRMRVHELYERGERGGGERVNVGRQSLINHHPSPRWQTIRGKKRKGERYLPKGEGKKRQSNDHDAPFPLMWSVRPTI